MLDENHRFTLSYDFNGIFFTAVRTAYVRNERGFWDYDQSAGGSRKLWETRDGAEASRKWEELISAEPRAVHSSTLRSGGTL